jgi:hypothetical protein
MPGYYKEKPLHKVGVMTAKQSNIIDIMPIFKRTAERFNMIINFSFLITKPTMGGLI